MRRISREQQYTFFGMLQRGAHGIGRGQRCLAASAFACKEVQALHAAILLRGPSETTKREVHLPAALASNSECELACCSGLNRLGQIFAVTVHLTPVFRSCTEVRWCAVSRRSMNRTEIWGK